MCRQIKRRNQNLKMCNIDQKFIDTGRNSGGDDTLADIGLRIITQ